MKTKEIIAKTIEMDSMTYEIMKYEEDVSEFHVMLGCNVVVDKSEAFPFIKIY